MKYFVLVFLLVSCSRSNHCNNARVSELVNILTQQGKLISEQKYVTSFKIELANRICDHIQSGDIIYIAEERHSGWEMSGLVYFTKTGKQIFFCKRSQDKEIKIDSSCHQTNLVEILNLVKDNFDHQAQMLMRKYDSLSLNDSPILEISYFDFNKRNESSYRFLYTYDSIIEATKNN